MLGKRTAGALLCLLGTGCLFGDDGRAHASDETTTAGDAASKPTVTFHTTNGSIPIEVEIADTPETRSRGLMFRESMAEQHGMVFIFPREVVQQFWMKNTYISLDMIFVNANFEVVGVVANAEPMTETSRRVDKPSLYVVEVIGGLATRLGFLPGTRVTMKGVPKSVER